MNKVWEKSRASGDGLLLLLAIANYADEQGNAWPAVSSLARKARCSRRHAQRLIGMLTSLKELEVSRAVGRHNCNHYRVTLGQDEKATSCDTAKGDILSGRHLRQERATFETGKGDLDVARSVRIRQDPSGQEEVRASQGVEGRNGASPRRLSRRDAVLASRTQWAALNARVKELEQDKRMDHLTAEGRAELRQARSALKKLQEKQARGEF